MAEPVEIRDVELIKRLAAGDDDAFLQFYRRHQGGLYRYAVHMSGSPQSAADVVQETFLTLIRHAGKFDEARGAPAAFLFGIARNHVRKMREKEGRYVLLSEERESGLSSERGGDPGPSNGKGHFPAIAGHADTIVESIEREEISERLHEAVRTLPDHYRDPVILCDLEGKSYSEAAVLLDCPVGTVRSRLNRARSILLDKLSLARSGGGATWARPRGKA
jgi:RNA polymerase sigma-70 factor (ECF subfamily)